MEPDRIRAYLQAACAGLGFDIGEVWWTSTENSSSAVAAIEEGPNNQVARVGDHEKKLRFVQLYTSKSYENRRSELVNPPDAEASNNGLRRSSSTENLQKHVLSPRLVDAISKTTQVVWANSRKQEGLIGRSDIRLQTAVGMPVAVDGDGNMCIVVMFSPNNVQSSDEAMEYLQSISLSATSSSIPCLLPVFDPNRSGMRALPHLDVTHQAMIVRNEFGDGVTARFCSLEDNHHDGRGSPSSDVPEVHNEHELSTAPKDTFGIPMLPSFAELERGNVTPEESIDVFDEASYGIWTTIMDSLNDENIETPASMKLDNDPSNESSIQYDPSLQVILPDAANMSEVRKERLREFCEAFLEMSVFDVADVWVPATNDRFSDCLRHVITVASTSTNERLNEFRVMSEHALIKFWTGAVGRAYSSGNPVWSANPNVFVDPARSFAFERAGIQTVLAVPVFSGKQVLPTCVVSCYALVRSGSVPFVLRFVQQALRLLWEGLDKFEPHESVGKDVWKGIGPADLGEMAADVEMQHHFMSKKRPHTLISNVERRIQAPEDPVTRAVTAQLESIQLPNGDTVNIPLQASSEPLMPLTAPGLDPKILQTHITEAVRSVKDAVPFSSVATNAEGTKRAHIIGPSGANLQIGMPLPMPRGFPSVVVPSPTTPSHETVNTENVAIHGGGLLSMSMPMQQQPVTLPMTSMSVPQHKVDQLSINNVNSVMNAMLGHQSSNFSVCLPVNYNLSHDEETSESKMCRIQGCDSPCAVKKPYCERHSGNRLCEYPDCGKCAQGSTRFCIAHGGGRRCTFPGCDKGARDKYFCAAHGGGKRCRTSGCDKSAVGGSHLCTAHGGGRRCSVDGCDKSAQSSTKFCVKHGGGKKCSFDGCEKVARGRTHYCAAHGGGIRCKLEGCNRVAIGKMQLCRAHGGTSTRSKNGRVSTTPTLPPAAFQPELFMQMQGVQGMQPEHMTSV